MRQITSKDYDRLYDLVCNHGFDVPCRLDYKFRGGNHIFTDYAAVKQKPDGICVSVRGCTYLEADEFQVRISLVFNTVKDMFKRDCHKNNLEWFDTFTENKILTIGSMIEPKLKMYAGFTVGNTYKVVHINKGSGNPKIVNDHGHRITIGNNFYKLI